MMLPIFGTPSGLTYWVMNNAKLAAEVLYGPTSVITANTIDELRTRWTQRGQKPVLFHADTPRGELVDLFSRVPGMAVVVVEPLHDIVSFASKARSLDAHAALRFATRSLTTLEPILARPSVWRLDARVHEFSLASFVDLLAEQMFPGASSEQVKEMRNRILSYNPKCADVAEAVHNFIMRSPAFRDGAGPGTAVLPDDLAKAARDFEQAVNSADNRSMTWPPGVFVRMSDLSYLDGLIDLTGPARVLIGGHALSLPSGRWRATAELSISGNASGNVLLSDIFAEDRPVCSGISPLPREGTFSYALDFECSDPYYPIIFRVAIMEGAIEGSLNLNKVHFQQRG